MRRPCTKKDAPTEWHGIWRTNIYKLKNVDRTTFYTPIEAKVMPAPTSKSPEEPEFEVDSGASVHMMSKKDLSSDDLDTLRRSRNPTVVLTANGEVHTKEEVQVYVHDNYSKKRLLFCRLENSAKTTDIPMSGSAVKNHG